MNFMNPESGHDREVSVGFGFFGFYRGIEKERF